MLPNPILRDLPDHIDSERLILRPPRPGDGPILYEAIVESLAELRPWMPWANTEPSVESSETYCRDAAARWLRREDLPLFLLRRSDGAFVGSTGLHRIDWDVPRFEIGYWMRTSETGKGYMSEAVNALTRFCFETLHAERVEIRCSAANERSAAVARRTGYVQEGHLRHNRRETDGTLHDTLIFGLLRDEYFARGG